MRIPAEFFRRDVLEVAPQLVGAVIARSLPMEDGGTVIRGRIVETEAYRGQEDLACHASKGRTPRTEMLFREGGSSYVYLVYGLHWLFNVVTGPRDVPQGVLIRALEKPLDGPAKWTRAFQITGAHNGLYLPTSEEIWLEEGEKPAQIRALPRVGIDYAAEPWKSMPWRFAEQ